MFENELCFLLVWMQHKQKKSSTQMLLSVHRQKQTGMKITRRQKTCIYIYREFECMFYFILSTEARL